MLAGMSGAQRILIVEDDVDLRRMIRLALAIAGYDIQEAGDGLPARSDARDSRDCHHGRTGDHGDFARCVC